MAESSIQNPSGSFPAQMKSWSALKAAYNLLNNEKATFEAVGGGHWQRSKESVSEHALAICDTTELDYGIHRDIEGAGPTGNGYGNGFLLHNALLVDAKSKSIIGLGAQVLHTRPAKTRKDNRAQKLKRDRESQIWGEAIDMIGPPQKGVRYTVVGDRASDNFEVFLHLQQNKHGWLLRAKSRNRLVFDAQGKRTSLAKALQGLDLKGSYELTARETKKSPARTAELEVFSGRVELPPPHHKSPFVKQNAPQRISTNVIWVREKNPPKDADRIEWVLYTSLPVATFNRCWQAIEYYEMRWIIEEYHKALKTGCRVDARQLQTASGLQAAIAFLSVVAVALIQLKTHAKSEPERKAKELVPAPWLAMLKAVRPRMKKVENITIREFYREIAKLGGFLGRKSDGEPGWITIWRGWEQMHMMVLGAQLLAAQQNPPKISG